MIPVVAVAVYAGELGAGAVLAPKDWNAVAAAQVHVDASHYTVCQGDRPRICVEPVNRPYLPLLREEVGKIYQEPDSVETLPGLILAGEGWSPTTSHVVVSHLEHQVHDVGVVSLIGARGLRPASTMDDQLLTSSIIQGAAADCPLDPELRMLFERPQAGQDARLRAWLTQYFAASKRCDVPRMRALASTRP